MEDANRIAERHVDAVEQSVAEARDAGPFSASNRVYSLLTIASLVGGLVFAGWSARAGAVAAKATAADLRPWVQISDVELPTVHLTYDVQAKRASARSPIKFKISNIGKTPAREIIVEPHLVLLKKNTLTVEREAAIAFANLMKTERGAPILSVIWPAQVVDYAQIRSTLKKWQFFEQVDSNHHIAPDLVAGDRFFPYLFIVCSYKLHDGTRALTTRTFNLNPDSEDEATNREWNQDNPYVVDNIREGRTVKLNIFERVAEDKIT